MCEGTETVTWCMFRQFEPCCKGRKPNRSLYSDIKEKCDRLREEFKEFAEDTNSSSTRCTGTSGKSSERETRSMPRAT